MLNPRNLMHFQPILSLNCIWKSTKDHIWDKTILTNLASCWIGPPQLVLDTFFTCAHAWHKFFSQFQECWGTPISTQSHPICFFTLVEPWTTCQWNPHTLNNNQGLSSLLTYNHLYNLTKGLLPSSTIGHVKTWIGTRHKQLEIMQCTIATN
jgi:hypothetical protein